MKTKQLLYRASTLIFCLWMLLNAFFYVTSEEANRLCAHFGMPGYLRTELAVAKVIGVIVLVLPFIKGNLKEWAYSGFTITVISGFIAHLASGDTIVSSLSALVALALLLTSYFSYHAMNRKQKL